MGSKSIACKPALLNKPAELASTAATDVGMHGLLASQHRVTILCYPLVCVHCGPVVDFFITKQTSLHPFDFVRNLFIYFNYTHTTHCITMVLLKHAFGNVSVVSCTPPPGPCTSHSVPPLWPVC